MVNTSHFTATYNSLLKKEKCFTNLDKEEFGLADEAGALVSLEGWGDGVHWQDAIRAVDDALITVTQYTHHKAVCLTVVTFRYWQETKQHPIILKCMQ